VDMATHTAMKQRYWHYWIGLLLGLALVQVLRFENLPLKFDWITLGVGYWILLAAQAIFYRLKRSSFLGMPRHSSAPKAAALLRRWTAT
jgi:hypothetical protein